MQTEKKMKVLMINGSPNEHGCTDTALKIVSGALAEDGVESETVWLGNRAVQDCIGCGACRKLNNRCVFDDDIVNRILEKAEQADGFVFGSPTFYAHSSGRILSVLDRVFYAGSSVFAGKPGAAVVSARRAGTTANLDVINKYFMISRMPVVSSCYWNMVHGNKPEEVWQDKEGVQIMRILGHEMSWLLKSIEAGPEVRSFPAGTGRENPYQFYPLNAGVRKSSRRFCGSFSVGGIFPVICRKRRL